MIPVVAAVLAWALSGLSSSSRGIEHLTTPGRGQGSCAKVTVWHIGTIVTPLIDSTGLSPSARGSFERSERVQRTKARMNMIVFAAARYCLESRGHLPVSLAELVQYRRTLPPHSSCTVDSTYLFDSWGKPFQYGVEAGQLTLLSTGPDSLLGTADDIGVPMSGSAEAEKLDASVVCGPGPSHRDSTR
jgi:hypothetical protein